MITNMVFDFDAAVAAPFRMQPGLRRMADAAQHLTPLAPGAPHLRAKLAVLSTHPAQALQVAPGFDAGPAQQALACHGAREHPDVFTWDGARATAVALGLAVDGDRVEGRDDDLTRCLRALPNRWRLAGLLSLAFAEDFALIDADSGTLPWLAVTLPSHWAPQDKVGRHFREVHAPVADNALLLRASDHLLRMVCEPERWERFVWTVTRHPQLNAHPAQVDPAPWSADAFADGRAPRAWWRTERQTFIALPGQRQALFTIRVEVTPLASAIDSPAKAARLHDAVASMSEAVLTYRNLTDVQAALLGWLAARAAAN